MGRQRPIGVILVAIWFFLAGFSTASSGTIHAFFYQWFFGLLGMALTAVGGPGAITDVIQILLIIIGVILVVGGLGYWVAAVGLVQGREWGRTGGITAAIAVALGWISLGVLLIAFLGSLGLFLPIFYIVIGLFNALPILYLMSDEVKMYCGGFEIPPTITDQPPTPVMTAPPPTPPIVTAPPPLSMPPPRIPGTEVIGAAQPPAAWLVARSSPRAGREHGLQRGRNTIGRDGTCDIVLDDTTVSKLHAEVRYENGQYVLYDHASTNGTFVNNHRTQRQSLLDGDDIRIGNSTFVFKQVKLQPNR